MVNVLVKIKRFVQKIRGLFPSPTPQGKAEFDAWATSIIELYQPKADERSVRFALSTMLLRLNPTEAYKAKFFFALCLHKAAAAQTAAFIMEEIKNEQRAEVAAQQQAAISNVQAQQPAIQQ